MVRYGYSGAMTQDENKRLENENAELEKRVEALKVRIEENRKAADEMSQELEEHVGASVVDVPALDISIGELDLSVRAYNCLHRAGCDTVEDIMKLVREDERGLDKIRNCGKRTKQEILDRLKSFGIDISDTADKAENRKELA